MSYHAVVANNIAVLIRQS